MDNEAFEDDEELSDEEAKAKLTKKRGINTCCPSFLWSKSTFPPFIWLATLSFWLAKYSLPRFFFDNWGFLSPCQIWPNSWKFFASLLRPKFPRTQAKFSLNKNLDQNLKVFEVFYFFKCALKLQSYRIAIGWIHPKAQNSGSDCPTQVKKWSNSIWLLSSKTF